jgi:hypothetical protein
VHFLSCLVFEKSREEATVNSKRSFCPNGACNAEKAKDLANFPDCGRTFA